MIKKRIRAALAFLLVLFVSLAYAQSESYLDSIYKANNEDSVAADINQTDFNYDIDSTASATAEDETELDFAVFETEVSQDEKTRINLIVNDLIRILLSRMAGVTLNFKILDCHKTIPTDTATDTSTSTDTSTDTATDTSTSTDTSTDTATDTSTSTDTSTDTSTGTGTDTSTSTDTSTDTATDTSTDTSTGTSTDTGTTATPEEMFTAIDNGDAAEVERLIAAGINLNWVDNSQRTFLMRAVYSYHNDIVQILIDAGSNLNARDAMNFTALHYAATQNNPGAVSLLTNAGLNVDVRGYDSPSDGPTESTPLHMAAQSGALEAAAALIEAGADVNALTNVRDGTFRRSPLFWAEKSGDSAMADLLISHGAVKYPEGATNN